MLQCYCAEVLLCCSANVLLLCFICLNECFSVSESMSITYRQTEPMLEVLADLKNHTHLFNTIDFQDGGCTATSSKYFHTMASSLLHVGYKSSFKIWHRKRYGIREMLKFTLSNLYIGMFSDDCCHSSWKRQQPVLLRRLDNHPLLFHQN